MQGKVKALLSVVMVAVAACGIAEGAEKPNKPNTVDTAVQATDSTVVVDAVVYGDTVSDAWRWRVTNSSVSGESTSDSISATIPRSDTTTTHQFCARGVNYNSDQSREAVGAELCSNNFDVPPAALEVPTVPDSIKVKVDSALASNIRLDSLADEGVVAVQAGPEVYCPVSGIVTGKTSCGSMEESANVAYNGDRSWRTVMRSVAPCFPEPNCLETGGDSTRAGVDCRSVDGPEGTGRETWACTA